MRKLKGRKGEKGKLRTMVRIDEDLIKKVDLRTRSRNDHQFHRDREPSLWGKLPALHRMPEEHRGGITMTLDTDPPQTKDSLHSSASEYYQRNSKNLRTTENNRRHVDTERHKVFFADEH